MTEAGIVSTLKRLCKWSGHGGISGDGLVQLLSVRIERSWRKESWKAFWKWWGWWWWAW